MSDTIFSRILTEEAEASFVYRDELVSAFMDIHPVNPGHTLVIPNKAVATLEELDNETAGRMFTVAKNISTAIRNSGLSCDGINLILADGEAAGQEVFHVHLHVVPRTVGDGFGFRYTDPSFQLAARPDLNQTAEQIRKAL